MSVRGRAMVVGGENGNCGWRRRRCEGIMRTWRCHVLSSPTHESAKESGGTRVGPRLTSSAQTVRNMSKRGRRVG